MDRREEHAMSGGRATSNPLALAVLACLFERPMHPYEMASTMRERGKERSIKLNYGSLYTVVDNLAKHGLIEAMEARREGRRPERTVYRLTDTGRIKLDAWMSDLLARPVKEYPQFEAALSLMPVLHPDHVLALLRERIRTLEKEITMERLMLDTASKAGLPRLLLIEGEYHLTMQQTELAWVQELADEIEVGTFEGLNGWRQLYETGEPPDWTLDLSVLDELRERAEGGTGPD
jgi:DNA-binding PadR family transcriptional regulator